MSFDEENAPLQAVNAFFAGSHGFDIIDAEFTHTTGTMTKVVTYNESNNSGFNNHYGNVYRGSRNLSTNYNGAFVDHRQFEARRYDTNLIHSQTHNHCIPAPSRGRPQFNPNCQKHGVLSPSRSPRSPQQHHYISDAPSERPPIESDTIRQHFDRDLPSSSSSGRGRERERLVFSGRNTWNHNPNQNSNQNQSSWDSDAHPAESQLQSYSYTYYTDNSSNGPKPSEPPLASLKPKSMAKNPYADFIRIATEPVIDQPAPPYARDPPRSSSPSCLDVEMEISPGEKAAAAAKLRRAIQESEAMLED